MLGKSCPLGLKLRSCFSYFMPSKVCVFLSHLVSRTGCGIRLYRFLILAFSSALLKTIKAFYY